MTRGNLSRWAEMTAEDMAIREKVYGPGTANNDRVFWNAACAMKDAQIIDALTYYTYIKKGS